LTLTGCCRRPLKEAGHVDHFIPWPRYAVDLGHNFVLAHASRNERKFDRLPLMLVRLGSWFPPGGGGSTCQTSRMKEACHCAAF
jgi:hypothetical protein